MNQIKTLTRDIAQAFIRLVIGSILLAIVIPPVTIIAKQLFKILMWAWGVV